MPQRYQDPEHPERIIYRAPYQAEIDISYDDFERCYEQIGLESPHLSAWEHYVNAVQLAHLETELAKKKQAGYTAKRMPRKCVLLHQASSFERALLDTTARMPVVKPVEEEQEA